MREGGEFSSQKRLPANSYAYEREGSLGKSYEMRVTGGLSLKIAY